MKTLNSPIKFMAHALLQSIRHPRTPIRYNYCSSCRLCFNTNDKKCPRCGDKVGHSPEERNESPIPWWGSCGLVVVGVVVCIFGACYTLPALDRIGDALVFIPLGNIFGMSLHRS